MQNLDVKERKGSSLLRSEFIQW